MKKQREPSKQIKVFLKTYAMLLDIKSRRTMRNAQQGINVSPTLQGLIHQAVEELNTRDSQKREV